MTYWIKTKTGRLKKPPELKKVDFDTRSYLVNWCGQPLPSVGDYVHPNGSVSAGTVGRIIEIDKSWDNGSGDPLNISGKMETLDGKIDSTWIWYMTVLPYEAVQEVKDFYIAAQRGDRIKVSW